VTTEMNSAVRYCETVRGVLSRLELQQIDAAADLLAAALGRGGIIHIFGSGHSSLLAQEMFYRAGGLVAVNPILDSRLGFERGAIESSEFERSGDSVADLAGSAGFRVEDVGIVVSNSGRNALPVEMAERMRAAGLKVIALTNLAQSSAATSRHSSGKRLFELADVILDNHCPVGDAAVKVPGISSPMGPVSTIAGAVLLHSVFLQAAELMAAQGKSPPVFPSANVGSGSLQALRRMVKPFEGRIRWYRPAS
jgi:uncharacterized phosphosugar-binding protein